MLRATPLNRYLAAAFASLTLLPISASALTLGNLAVHSYLGQPMRAQVLAKIGPDEAIDISCISLGRPGAAQEQFPYLTHAQLSVENTAKGQLIRIRSNQAINEPILKVLLHVTCGGQTSLSREFTLLLDPQDMAAPLPDEELPLAKASDIPASPKPGSEWEIRPGDRLDTLVRAMYPSSRSKQRRMEQVIVEANPLIFKHGRQNDLPTGHLLSIPKLPQRAVAAVSPAHNRPQKIAKRAETADSFQLKLTTGEIDLSTSRNLTEADRLRLREKQLLLEADDQVANILALKNRVKQLETQINELSLKMSQVNERSEPSQPAQPAQIAATAKVAEKPHRESYMQWFWYGLAGLAALLGTFLGVRHRKQKQESAETLQSFQLSMPAPAEPAVRPASSSTPDRPRGATNAQTPAKPTEEPDYDPHSIFLMPEEKISLTEVDSVIEEADLYLIYGWTEKATNLLQQYTEKHPLELQPWMMLFDIYHSQGMKEAFDKLVPRFKENFDNTEAWKKIQVLGHAISPKNPMYLVEGPQSAAHGTASGDTAEGEKKASAADPGDDYWSQAKIDFRPNTIQQHDSNQPPADNTDTSLPRIKDI